MTKSKKHNKKNNNIETENKKNKKIGQKGEKIDKNVQNDMKKKEKGTITKNDNEIVKLIKIVLLVTIIMIIFYGITMLVTKNRELSTYENSGNSEKAVIQYESIMLGTLLNRGEGTYYVLIEEKDDQRIVEYDNLIQLATAKEETPRFYTANLTDSFNKDYLAKEANITNNIDEFKVSGTTLIKVKDGKVADSYINCDEIKKELESLSD